MPTVFTVLIAVAAAIWLLVLLGWRRSRAVARQRRADPTTLWIPVTRIGRFVVIPAMVVCVIGTLLAVIVPLVRDDSSSALDGAPEWLLIVVAIGLLGGTLAAGGLVVLKLPYAILPSVVIADEHHLRLRNRLRASDTARIDWLLPYEIHQSWYRVTRRTGNNLSRVSSYQVYVFDLHQGGSRVRLAVEAIHDPFPDNAENPDLRRRRRWLSLPRRPYRDRDHEPLRNYLRERVRQPGVAAH